ncbi:hypothetical protein CBS101457_002701 [Exobasidium rhododendri]|nr:hypothetical protein CBS101457_002701 [Exobasidium rhododendri]
MFHRAAAPLLRKGVPSLASSSSRQTTRFLSVTRQVYAGKSDAEATTSDPGYTTTKETLRQAPPAKDAAPSIDSDPFPLPFDPRLEGLSLSSKHQLENLTKSGEDAFPLRVPGREPGDESREIKIARLKYQIRHRGILETDLILSTFSKEHLAGLSDAELDEFDTLLDEPDWDIYYWMTARKEVPDRWKETFETENRLGWRLRKHTKNENKETRSMPNL